MIMALSRISVYRNPNRVPFCESQTFLCVCAPEYDFCIDKRWKKINNVLHCSTTTCTT